MMVTQKVKKELKPLDTRYLCYGVGGMGKKCVVGFKEHKQHRKQVKVQIKHMLNYLGIQ